MAIASRCSLHRDLIHLRAEHSALGMGVFVPLSANSDAVAAYLRRDGPRVALVIANLGPRLVAGAGLGHPTR